MEAKIEDREYWLVVDEPVVYSNRTYEAAARYTEHEIDPGRYRLNVPAQPSGTSILWANLPCLTTVDTYHGVSSKGWEPREETVYWGQYVFQLVHGASWFGKLAHIEVIDPA